MENDREIEEIMMGMVYEKAMKIYSGTLIEHGTNPRNYGAIDYPDGYAKIIPAFSAIIICTCL